MATFVLSATDRFPVGTTVKAYLKSNFPAVPPVPSGPPLGSQTASATVASDGTTTFSSLADDTAYVAYASVSGQDRYVQFRTAPASVGSGSTDISVDGAPVTDIDFTGNLTASDVGAIPAAEKGVAGGVATYEQAAAGGGATVDLAAVATVEDLAGHLFDNSTISASPTYVPLGGVVPFPCRLSWAACVWTPSSAAPTLSTVTDYWLAEVGKFMDAETGATFHPIVSKMTYGSGVAADYLLGENPSIHRAWTFDAGTWDQAAAVLAYRDTLWVRWTKFGGIGNMSRIAYAWRLEPLA